MTNEFELGPELVQKLQEATGREYVRAVIKGQKRHPFYASSDQLRLAISARQYNLDIHVFEPDGLKTLELSISPELMARIIKQWGKALEREGVIFPQEELHDAFMRAHTAIIEARKRTAPRQASF